ncbi:MAG: hypothetical protein SH859_11845 [Hyphomicrobium aestuarii]|nr:hypothetical protein [Hyphomicrobium aestuarii]
MARSVGPELDDLQRLIRRLQTDEIDSSGKSDSTAKPDTAPNLTVVPAASKPGRSPEKTTVAATPTTSQGLVLSSLSNRDAPTETSSLSAEAADALEDGTAETAELKTYRGTLRGADSVQTTLQELVELRTPEPHRARELLELARRDGEAGGIEHHSAHANPPFQGQHAERNGFNVSLIVAVAIATLVSTIASVYLLLTFAVKPPTAPTPAASSTASPAPVRPVEANPALASRPYPLPVDPPTNPALNLSEPSSIRAGTPAAVAPAAEPAVGSGSLPPSSAPGAPGAAEAGRPGDASAGAPSATSAIMVPTIAAAPAPAVIVSPLTVEAVWLANRGTPFNLPVVITVEPGLATQLLISGLEAEAAISNGLEILPGTWLIDQNDVSRAQLERGAGAKPSLPVDVQLRSADGQLIARKYVLLKSEPVGPPAGAAE